MARRYTDAYAGDLVGQILGWIFFGVFRLIFMLFRALFRMGGPKQYQDSVQTRVEHTHIVAGSGHGKTELLKTLISRDLDAVLQGRRSIIVIDSQGDMIKRLLSLQMFSPSKKGLSERLIYIDPSDVENPPCLNLFDFGLDRLNSYTPLEREKMINGAIALYEYLFGALLGAELTNNQRTLFRYVARLLMVVPGATIYTLMEFMEDPHKAKPYVEKLDPTFRQFFVSQFYSSTYDRTRQQILNRLWGVLENRNLARMFSHSQNKLNMFEAMNNGSIILINTAKDLLKQQGTEIFGRFMIALISQATQERSAIPEQKRLPTYVYIDEAQDYLGAADELFQELVSQARKFKVALTISHQSLTQLSKPVQDAVMACAATKIIGGASHGDIERFAREINAAPKDMLSVLHKTATETNFVKFNRNEKPPINVLTVPFGDLERAPRMKLEEQQQLLEQNRRRFAAPVDEQLIASSIGSLTTPVFNLDEPTPL